MYTRPHSVVGLLVFAAHRGRVQACVNQSVFFGWPAFVEVEDEPRVRRTHCTIHHRGHVMIPGMRMPQPNSISRNISLGSRMSYLTAVYY